MSRLRHMCACGWVCVGMTAWSHCALASAITDMCVCVLVLDLILFRGQPLPFIAPNVAAMLLCGHLRSAHHVGRSLRRVEATQPLVSFFASAKPLEQPCVLHATLRSADSAVCDARSMTILACSCSVRLVYGCWCMAAIARRPLRSRLPGANAFKSVFDSRTRTLTRLVCPHM